MLQWKREYVFLTIMVIAEAVWLLAMSALVFLQ
jgi:hypothetical protein